MPAIEAYATYLHCPQCRLTRASRKSDPARPDCPRCARAGTTTAMYASPLNAAELQVRLDRLRPLPAVRGLAERFAGRSPGSQPARSRPIAG